MTAGSALEELWALLQGLGGLLQRAQIGTRHTPLIISLHDPLITLYEYACHAGSRPLKTTGCLSVPSTSRCFSKGLVLGDPTGGSLHSWTFRCGRDIPDPLERQNCFYGTLVQTLFKIHAYFILALLCCAHPVLTLCKPQMMRELQTRFCVCS